MVEEKYSSILIYGWRYSLTLYENIRSFYKTAIIVANYSEYKCGGCLLGDTKILLNNKKVKLAYDKDIIIDNKEKQEKGKCC